MSLTERKVTTRWVLSQKGAGNKLAMLTAYDAHTAQVLDAAGVDILLVGDSLGMAVLGMDNTLGVTVDMVAHHTRAVARGSRCALVVGDMPFLSYHAGLDRAVLNAGELVRAGAEAVKLEGGRRRVPVVDALVNAEIPVMGHIGLTPQSLHKMGGFKVQGRQVEAARGLVEDARALEQAGVFALVLEGIPDEVGREITSAVSVPTIGIGAGPHCDGQVLVTNDVLGLSLLPRQPKFVRRYADLGSLMADAIGRYVSDVKRGSFPAEDECYHLSAEVARDFEGG